MKASEMLNRTMLLVTYRLEHIHYKKCYLIDNCDLLISSRIIIEMRYNADVYPDNPHERIKSIAKRVAEDISSEYNKESLKIVNVGCLKNKTSVVMALLHRYGYSLNIVNDSQMIIKDLAEKNLFIYLNDKYTDNTNIEILSMYIVERYSEFYIRRLNIDISS